MHRRRLAPVIAIVVIAGLVISIVKLWRFSPYKVSRDLVGNPQVVLSLHDVEIAGRSGGKRMWSFRADDVDVSRGRLRTIIRGIHDGKLFDSGKLVARVTAGEAVYDAVNQNIEVTHGAKVDAALGFKAWTERVLWSSATRLLICPDNVVFRSGDSKLVGRNLVADVGQKEVTLQQGKMQIVLEDIQKLEKGAGKAAPGEKK